MVVVGDQTQTACTRNNLRGGGGILGFLARQRGKREWGYTVLTGFSYKNKFLLHF